MDGASERAVKGNQVHRTASVPPECSRASLEPLQGVEGESLPRDRGHIPVAGSDLDPGSPVTAVGEPVPRSGPVAPVRARLPRSLPAELEVGVDDVAAGGVQLVRVPVACPGQPEHGPVGHLEHQLLPLARGQP